MSNSPVTSDQATALATLINQFDGDATAALLALAQHAQIAVAWMDRDYLARHFRERNIVLTDEMWAQLANQIDDFDNYVGDNDINVHLDFANQCLYALGLYDAAEQERPHE